MSSIAQMVATLAQTAAMPWDTLEPVPVGLTRTERIRRLLKGALRPVSAEEIAWDMGDHFPNFGTHLVWLLLKHDISRGRVLLVDKRYRWNHDYDSAQAIALRDAMALLRRHHYQVTAPQMEGGAP